MARRVEAFRFSLQRRHHGVLVFRGLIPGPHVPCQRFDATLTGGSA
jgi:hypothetical protein